MLGWKKDNCLSDYLWVPTVCQQTAHMPSGETEKPMTWLGKDTDVCMFHGGSKEQAAAAKAKMN